MLQTGDPLPEGAPEGAEGEDRRLAVFDEFVAEVAARVEPAYRQADGWLEQTRAGLIELLRFCDERSEVARELVINSIAWGPEVLRRRGQLLDTLAAALDGGHAPGTAENLVGACISLVHTRLLQAEGGRFLELAPSLMSIIVHPYLGPRAAKRELERSSANAAAAPAEHDSGSPVAAVRQRSY
jgi:hypothetical protein